MKKKNVIFIALFFALFFMLFRCEARSSRGYLEKRIGPKISQVYPTKNIEDLFEQYPYGFTINQFYRSGDKTILIMLDGVAKGKPLEGAIKVFNKDRLDAEKVITFTYFQGKFSYDNEEEARRLWPQEKFLFQEMKLNKEILSEFKIKDTDYDSHSGGFDLEYIVTNEQINQFLKLDNQQQVTLGLHVNNVNRLNYYWISVEIGSDEIFSENILH